MRSTADALLSRVYRDLLDAVNDGQIAPERGAAFLEKEAASLSKDGLSELYLESANAIADDLREGIVLTFGRAHDVARRVADRGNSPS